MCSDQQAALPSTLGGSFALTYVGSSCCLQAEEIAHTQVQQQSCSQLVQAGTCLAKDECRTMSDQQLPAAAAAANCAGVDDDACKQVCQLPMIEHASCPMLSCAILTALAGHPPDSQQPVGYACANGTSHHTNDSKDGALVDKVD
jgi:hypothetical protein